MTSPFSFHCMICFEEFDVENRHPVVLPCGHTYVCNQCADRLDKCMECRTSLVQVIPRGPGGDIVNMGRGGGRWSSRSAGAAPPGGPPQPPIKKRLPLPKNVVLMSLIEATELAAESVRSQEQRPSLDESPHLTIPTAIFDLDDEEEQKIRTGTSLAISECGTYAVAAKEGLEIYPSRPLSDMPEGNEQGAEDEEVDTLVRFFHLEHQHDIGESQTHDDDLRTELQYKETDPARLRWGDRVQIVSTEAGWAKLARGYGYVRADKNRLVKGTFRTRRPKIVSEIQG
jgi:Zinc finger, C3HC4 type (RING finger)